MIFTCRDNFEDVMTCIFEGWSWGLKHGMDRVYFAREPVVQKELFEEYQHVDCNLKKAERVMNAIKQKISVEAWIAVHYAALSCEEDAIDAIYSFLRKGFDMGSKTMLDLTCPAVMRMMELRRSVGNEIHYFREFTRFTAVDGNLYVAHIEPKNNISYLTACHFADRMPSENFIIADDNRKQAVIHPVEQDMYIRQLTDEEFQLLERTEEMEDVYTHMWRTFFQNIAIKQRANYDCQRNMMPLWMRKHAVEFK